MNIKYIFLLFILGINFVGSEIGFAQQYIDIDLSAPTPPPKKQTPPPAKKPKPISHPTQKPAQPQTQQPKSQPVVKPILKQPVPVKQQTPAVTKPAQRPILTPPIVAPAPVPKIEKTLTDTNNSTKFSSAKPVRYKNRHGLAVDYTTWYETLKLTNVPTKQLVEGTSHYFGISFNYDFTVYRERWGYALTAGAVTGNAQAGTKDAGSYYERRVVWTGFRAGGRLFWRANNRIDLGLGFLAQHKSTKWPDEDNYIVVPQVNPHYFYYLDTRWRLNYRYELVQSFGTHLRSYALAWMLGLTYTLN